MSQTVELLKNFVKYAALLDGDEKGEAQVFCDRLFKAFGHAGYKEAGASLEFRIKKLSTKGTSFADLMWKPRVLIEMKKRGEKLNQHYRQAFDYWLNAVPSRPRYVILCNFDEFQVYDFDRQMNEPVDTLTLEELPRRYSALNFLFPDDPEPVFGNDRTEVSKRAAIQMAALFKSLISRKTDPVDRIKAQRFVLQLVIAMFAEDIDLLPASTVSGIVNDCLNKKQSSYDLFGGLFRQMNNPTPAAGGRFKDVPYFNGGLFANVDPIELTKAELELIGWRSEDGGASTENWATVNPAIFGTLFEQSMDVDVRHQHGRHFTSEADIQRVIGPTLVKPWAERIAAATTATELRKLRKELASFRVLDPACGSGNFLYVAFRELARLDLSIMLRLQSEFSRRIFEEQAKAVCAINPKQFFGLDNDAFGVELAKVTLMLAKKLALDAAVESFSEGEHKYAKGTHEIQFEADQALPLDNLDDNIRCVDALFTEWPPVDAIVGNPPYQAKNKAQGELTPAYLKRLRMRHPAIDGRADFCVYWLRLAHDHLQPGQRAGLVATNTIRQNYSREGGLDYIVANGGVITEAVSSMIWPGEAVVHVAIANWIKGSQKGKKRLHIQDGNNVNEGWRYEDLDTIGPALSFSFDVTKAKKLLVNAKSGNCFQGQTHGHEAFLVDADVARAIIKNKSTYKSVLKPFLIADDLVGNVESSPSRYVIDFSGMELLEAEKYTDLFDTVKTVVLPQRKKAAKEEEARNAEILAENPGASVNRHHANFLRKWWQMSYPRGDLMASLKPLKRYIVCGQVTKRPIFDFVSTKINPNAALTVFPFDDDYTFGILQSSIHWTWFVARCSTLKSDPRYTSNTVFDSFPWPQHPTLAAAKKVARAAVALREERALLREKHQLPFRDLYRKLEGPGDNSLKKKQAALDLAVRDAYGMSGRDDALKFLLALNNRLAGDEAAKKAIQGPGLPPSVIDRREFVTDDCIRPVM
ncbi:DNA methyltransferase [Paraburkholderia youngii]|uniref:site-specific DNA-methyltransferase (adenine-specific) n=1 Tax=Paraburkholderia youngii TaxID=2782701 RepID=A0A7W8P3J8_9BURK|nr:DNA methyltransferase [Paraburkholderia youngii]MBB5400288.1 hypothetical protein [Paraburkholderia youngii]